MTQCKPVSILLVEDDENAREIVGSMLTMAFPDMQFYSAGNGKTGLDLFQAYQPDIVITDISMPEMDGIQLLGNILGRKPDTRIIVITAHSEKQKISTITATNIDIDLILKPVDFGALMASINRFITAMQQPC